MMSISSPRPNHSKTHKDKIRAEKRRALEALRGRAWWRGVGLGETDDKNLQVVVLSSLEGKSAAVQALASLCLEVPWMVRAVTPITAPQPPLPEDTPERGLREHLRAAITR